MNRGLKITKGVYLQCNTVHGASAPIRRVEALLASLRPKTSKEGEGEGRGGGREEGGSYWYLKGGCLDGGGEGGEGWVLDCGHDGAAICL